jgi:hypothetical protein
MIRWALRALAGDREFMRLLYLHAQAVRGGARVARDLIAPQEANNAGGDGMFASMQKAGELRSDVPPREMTELYVFLFSERVARWLAEEDDDVAKRRGRGDREPRGLVPRLAGLLGEPQLWPPQRPLRSDLRGCAPRSRGASCVMHCGLSISP